MFSSATVTPHAAQHTCLASQLAPSGRLRSLVEETDQIGSEKRSNGYGTSNNEIAVGKYQIRSLLDPI
jgi:hypothetical protein